MPKRLTLPQKSKDAIKDLVIKDAEKRLLDSKFMARLARLLKGKSAAKMKLIMTKEFEKALDGLETSSLTELRRLHAAGEI